VPKFKYEPRWKKVKTKYIEVFTLLAYCMSFVGTLFGSVSGQCIILLSKREAVKDC
jgi:hypothetical protein